MKTNVTHITHFMSSFPSLNIYNISHKKYLKTSFCGCTLYNFNCDLYSVDCCFLQNVCAVKYSTIAFAIPVSDNLLYTLLPALAWGIHVRSLEHSSLFALEKSGIQSLQILQHFFCLLPLFLGAALLSAAVLCGVPDALFPLSLIFCFLVLLVFSTFFAG